ncbi:MAG: hypothetical protein M5T61_17400 [Acidimicrobiia bacterium]|nr:hypothetical protein [Acidimicrobiia bacterium]
MEVAVVEAWEHGVARRVVEHGALGPRVGVQLLDPADRDDLAPFHEDRAGIVDPAGSVEREDDPAADEQPMSGHPPWPPSLKG